MILPTDDDPPARRLGLNTTNLPATGRHARALLRRAFDLGVRLIDTGPAFAHIDHTAILRRVLRDRPDGTVIAANAAMTRCRPDELFDNGRPIYLRKQAEDRRRRLRVERIDLLNIHINTAIDLDGQIDVLRELRHDGTINHIGLRSPTVKQIDAVREHLPVAAVTHTYNHAERQNDDVLDHCERHRIAFIPDFPFPFQTRGPLMEIAAETGTAPATVALAWLLRRSPVILPTPGARTTEQLDAHMAAAPLALTDDQEARL